MKRIKKNHEMVEIFTLRRENKNLTERNDELTKMLSRAAREIETLQAQLGDDGIRYLLDKIKHVMSVRYRVCFGSINLGLRLIPKYYRTHTFVHNCMMTKKIKVKNDYAPKPVPDCQTCPHLNK